MKKIMDSTLTDTFYTILLGLDGCNPIGNSEQQQFTILDENKNQVCGREQLGEVEAFAYEYFHEKKPILKILNLTNIKEIEDKLLTKHNPRINFPKQITFNFPDNYKNIVTNIKTTEISAECILYNSVESINVTKEFSDSDYWNKDFKIKEIKDYWFFGANGQGDLWIMHKKNRIYFYDHNKGDISEENLIDLNIDFGKWLQFAFLNKQLEEIDLNNNLTQEIKEIYKLKLNELSSVFAENYPFEI
ncbi:hypothetical protein AAG747_28940 [Rapidithrix thailandica]|uniref:SMI1/KNR4 family protein n=1 Tax=Rapidithrix thailandica TaxID=413964 RepID=A0AAW9SMI4_9BACT